MSRHDMIRVRIAPSPTGPLHIGTARSALYNYLFARKHGGTFIVRVEDTDLERSDERHTEGILKGLDWLGLEWDEGPMTDGSEKGEYGPYRQSRRQAVYQTYIQKLIDEGIVYPCFCHEEELREERQRLLAEGNPPIYNGKCRNLSKDRVHRITKEGKRYVLRFCTPDKTVVFDDVVRGRVSFETKLIGDFVIAKDETTPLYNLAAVIDDETMKISHVIRGEDHISNTPKQILLQEALGFSRPVYAHLPLILNEDRSKLSKRKNRVSVEDYRDAGYLPEAILNFLVLLGWNPKTKQEIFSKETMIQAFDLKKVHKGGAVLTSTRLDWINGYYIRKLSPKEFVRVSSPFLEKAGISLDDPEYVERAVRLEQDRIKTLVELPDAIRFFFEEPEYEDVLLRWKETPWQTIVQNLRFSLDYFMRMPEEGYRENVIADGLKGLIVERHLDRGSLLWPLRVALTGRKASPGPFEIAAVLGKTRVLPRIRRAIEKVERSVHLS